HLDDRGHRDALLVVSEALEVGVLEPGNLQHRVDATWVEIEGPAVVIVRWSAKANGEHVFQAKQASHDDRAVGPWAGARDDQPVAVGFDGIAVAAVGRDAGGDV